MTLLAVESSPSLRLISKAAEVDPDGTHELLRLGLYETLCDQIDQARPALEGDAAMFVAKREAMARQVLVRKFIDARLAGESVDPFLDAAEVVAKAGPRTEEDAKHGWWRDMMGRFTSHTNTGTSTLAAYRGSKESDAEDPFDKPRYSHLRATGAALNTLDSPNAKTLGAAAQAIGAFGPEAEKVLGNGLRRTAYRYRGTEKRPDKALKDQIKQGQAIIDPAKAEQAARLQSQANDNEIRARALAGKPFDKDRSSVRAQTHLSSAAAIGQYYHRRGKNLSQDQLEMRVAGDIAANYYLDKLPSEESTAIAIAAGRVPPSQGVIIDADGDVVSEAMGFNGDHYVPFDLKNLRSLQGGQYVRTRAVGGPTSEDIYTGLLSGARQVQVVSQSGVFTMELDPSLRGGRRYSDKARQMVSRYERILDAIDKSKESGLYQVDITAAERRAIQQKAAERYSGDDLKTVVDREVDRLRESKQFKMLSDDEIVAEAKSRLRSTDNKGELKNLIADVREENRAESVKRFQLDGDGYEAALKTLQTEFPYFVRSVKRERLPDFVNQRGLNAHTRYSGATDQGYVAPSTKATGRARAVNSKQTAYDKPQRARAGAPAATEGAAEGDKAPEGAGAVQSPDKGHGFHDIRTDAKAQRAVKIIGDRMNVSVGMLAAPDKNTGDVVVQRGFGLDVVDDGEFKLMDDAQALFAVHERAAKAGDLLDYMAKAGPNERAAYLKALDNAQEVAETHGLPDPEKFGDMASDLAAVLRVLQPFGPKGDPKTYRPDEHGGLPMEISGVASLGLNPPKYAEFESKMLANSNLTALVESYSDSSDMAAAADQDIASAQREYEDDPTDLNLRELGDRQLAFAYAHGKKLAQDYFRATNQDWDAVGKALAGPESAATPSRTFQKRVVRWHPPGSALATEFQKFLASR